MSRRITLISAAALAAVLYLVGCASGGRGDSENSVSSAEEIFLARPRFNKPTARPLGRFLLTWESVEGATGYRIEMSASQNILPIDRAWTIKGNNLELPIKEGETLYFRIRSFDETTTSRWSTVLEVKEDQL